MLVGSDLKMMRCPESILWDNLFKGNKLQTAKLVFMRVIIRNSDEQLAVQALLKTNKLSMLLEIKNSSQLSVNHQSIWTIWTPIMAIISRYRAQSAWTIQPMIIISMKMTPILNHFQWLQLRHLNITLTQFSLMMRSFWHLNSKKEMVRRTAFRIDNTWGIISRRA